MDKVISCSKHFNWDNIILESHFWNFGILILPFCNSICNGYWWLPSVELNHIYLSHWSLSYSDLQNYEHTVLFCVPFLTSRGQWCRIKWMYFSCSHRWHVDEVSDGIPNRRVKYRTLIQVALDIAIFDEFGTVSGSFSGTSLKQDLYYSYGCYFI